MIMGMKGAVKGRCLVAVVIEGVFCYCLELAWRGLVLRNRII